MLAWLSLTLLLLFSGAGFCSVKAQEPPQSEALCAFCNPEILEAQVYYEGSTALVLLTHQPIYPGHSLIIPKRHVEALHELTDEEAAELFHLVQLIQAAMQKAYGVEAYFLAQKNHLAWQSVPHVHLHYIPIPAEHGSFSRFCGNSLWSLVTSRLTREEMQSLGAQLRAAMESSAALSSHYATS